MATTSSRGRELFYTTDGDGPAVVFVAEAGLGGWCWGWQHAALAGPFETVVWDLPGTGRSAPVDGPLSLSELVTDFEAICGATQNRTVHVVGLGLGGAVALGAARQSTRIETLALIGTASHADAFDLDALFDPLESTDEPPSRDGVRASTEAALSPAFRAAHPDVIDGIVDWRLEGDADRPGRRAQRAALEGFDARDWLVEVTQPTLVFHGTADRVVDVAAGRELARGLPRGTVVPLEGAGHLANVEHSRAVNDRLLGALEAATDQLDEP